MTEIWILVIQGNPTETKKCVLCKLQGYLEDKFGIEVKEIKTVEVE